MNSGRSIQSIDSKKHPEWTSRRLNISNRLLIPIILNRCGLLSASMQHSDYRTTAKHYIDRKEIAKDMVGRGFRVFPKRPLKELQRTLLQDTPIIKKDPANLQGLDYESGAYRNRTDDLLTTRDNTGFSTGLHYTLLHYITKVMYSCFSYILHRFSDCLANYLANFNCTWKEF
jgi:hypothetical protein